MLQHLKLEEQKPKRVVVLGCHGFIGREILRHLKEKKIETLGLGRVELDLTEFGATEKLVNILRDDDVIVFVSAKAPCKNLEMFIENIQIAKTVCAALKLNPVSHVIYISSDAVYGDADAPMTEMACAQPASIHGAMHLTREIALQQEFLGPLAIIRPTLVYGLNDPHNGYGPNRFRRLAATGAEIILFGEGEERRDHVHVEDIAELVCRIVLRKSVGIINAVSGEAVSFRELAEFTAKQFSPISLVKGVVRSGPIPHNGYRAFDNSALSLAFPGFNFKSWKEGVLLVNDQFKLQASK